MARETNVTAFPSNSVSARHYQCRLERGVATAVVDDVMTELVVNDELETCRQSQHATRKCTFLSPPYKFYTIPLYPNIIDQQEILNSMKSKKVNCNLLGLNFFSRNYAISSMC